VASGEEKEPEKGKKPTEQAKEYANEFPYGDSGERKRSRESRQEDDQESGRRGIQEPSHSIEQVKAAWEQVIIDVKVHDRRLQAILRGIHPEDVQDATVFLRAESSFHSKTLLHTGRNREIVETILSKHLGKEYHIECDTASRASGTPKPWENQNLAQIACEDEYVKRAMNVFDAAFVVVLET
jgi:hypothetical protein